MATFNQVITEVKRSKKSGDGVRDITKRKTAGEVFVSDDSLEGVVSSVNIQTDSLDARLDALIEATFASTNALLDGFKAILNDNNFGLMGVKETLIETEKSLKSIVVPLVDTVEQAPAGEDGEDGEGGQQGSVQETKEKRSEKKETKIFSSLTESISDLGESIKGFAGGAIGSAATVGKNLLKGAALFLLLPALQKVLNSEDLRNFIKEMIPKIVDWVTRFTGAISGIFENGLSGILDAFSEMPVTFGLITAGILSKLGLIPVILSGVTTGLSFILTAFKVFRTFMAATFIPAITGAFSTMMTTLSPILVAAAPFIAIGVAIGAALFGLFKLLEHLRDSLGFESIFDVLGLGVAYIQDAFAGLANMFIDFGNMIMGLVNKVGKFLGIELELPEFEKLSTDNAERFKEEARAKKEAKEADVVQDSGQPTVRVMTKDGFKNLTAEQIEQGRKDGTIKRSLATSALRELKLQSQSQQSEESRETPEEKVVSAAETTGTDLTVNGDVEATVRVMTNDGFKNLTAEQVQQGRKDGTIKRSLATSALRELKLQSQSQQTVQTSPPATAQTMANTASGQSNEAMLMQQYGIQLAQNGKYNVVVSTPEGTKRKQVDTVAEAVELKETSARELKEYLESEETRMGNEFKAEIAAAPQREQTSSAVSTFQSELQKQLVAGEITREEAASQLANFQSISSLNALQQNQELTTAQTNVMSEAAAGAPVTIVNAPSNNVTNSSSSSTNVMSRSFVNPDPFVNGIATAAI